ncbi:MAG: hypothetical protein ACAI38_13630 [Myxococcota bacterium]
MKRLLPLLLLTGCGVDLEVPEGLEVTCATDAECQDGKVCALLIGRCVDSVDSVAPRIVAADPPTPDRVRVVYSEPVACTQATSSATYVISPPLAASLVNGSGCKDSDSFTTEAVLFTDLQAPLVDYTLTAIGIVDSGGNLLAADGSSTTFKGFGAAPDPSPPLALVPLDASRVLGRQQSLVWTARPGVDTYIVEVATDAGFATPISGSPFVVEEATLNLTGLEDVTYFWRVRSNLTAVGTVLAVQSFDVLVDTVYVACASEPCEGGVRNGSRTRPYAGLQRALAAAAELSTSIDVPTPTIKIAARGPSTPYVGAVILQWQSVRVEGGWDATFTSRSTDPTQTVLEAPGSVMLVSNLPGAVSASIERLTLRTPSDIDANTLTVTAASSSLLFREVIVEGRSNGLSHALSISGGPAAGPRFQSCVFTMAPADTSSVQLAVIRNAAPSFDSCTFAFAPGSAQDAVAVEVQGPLPGNLVFDGCDIASGAGANLDGHSYGVQVSMVGASAGRVELVRSTVTSNTADVSGAVYLQQQARIMVDSSVLAASDAVAASEALTQSILLDAPEIVVRNSVLSAGEATNAYALRAANSPSLTVTNSLLLTRATSAGAADAMTLYNIHPILTNNIFATADINQPCVGMQLLDSDVLPIAMLNNVFLHCNGYRTGTYTATTTAGINALDGVEITDDGCLEPACPNARFAGNVVMADTFDNVFVDWDGDDDDPATIADNDYHLLAGADAQITEGGLDSSANSCAPQGESAPCNVPLTDIDGQARDVPYSIGPDEVP